MNRPCSILAVSGTLMILACHPVNGSGSPDGPCPVSTPNTPGGPDPFGGCFPGPGNTGPDPTITLTAYTGPTDIHEDNVTIEGKIIGSPGGTPVDLRIGGTNFVLKNSVLYGVITQIDDPAYPNPNYTVINTRIDSTGDTMFKSAQGDGITLLNNDISGSFSGGVCSFCRVENNWFHNQWIPDGSDAHVSGYRMDQHTTLRHNTLSCELSNASINTSGGCSANLTGYGDWDAVEFNTIDRNLLTSTPGATYFCAYGGSSGTGGGKAFADQTNNVVFTDNVFQKGSSGTCGEAGAIVDFIPSLPGNVWTGNRWDDGTELPAD